MKLDIDHVLFWMDAIRNSSDRSRVLESFWKGQIKSKVWLIENLKPYLKENSTVDIFGGWNGVLASLLFQTDVKFKKITSIDIDASCKDVALTINKIEEMSGLFDAVTADMCNYVSSADYVINTSCEHINQEQYDSWLSLIPDNCLVILQSNNYKIPEHIRTAQSIDEFIEQSNLNVIFSSILSMPLYDRYMIIGKKC
jgi:hypothetical protein